MQFFMYNSHKCAHVPLNISKDIYPTSGVRDPISDIINYRAKKKVTARCFYS